MRSRWSPVRSTKSPAPTSAAGSSTARCQTASAPSGGSLAPRGSMVSAVTRWRRRPSPPRTTTNEVTSRRLTSPIGSSSGNRCGSIQRAAGVSADHGSPGARARARGRHGSALFRDRNVPPLRRLGMPAALQADVDAANAERRALVDAGRHADDWYASRSFAIVRLRDGCARCTRSKDIGKRSPNSAPISCSTRTPARSSSRGSSSTSRGRCPSKRCDARAAGYRLNPLNITMLSRVNAGVRASGRCREGSRPSGPASAPARRAIRTPTLAWQRAMSRSGTLRLAARTDSSAAMGHGRRTYTASSKSVICMIRLSIHCQQIDSQRAGCFPRTGDAPAFPVEDDVAVRRCVSPAGPRHSSPGSCSANAPLS